MTSRDFVYWLQGFFEISSATSIGDEEVSIIRKHLNMVFIHEIDPSHGDKAHQEKLAKAHGGAAAESSGFHKPPKARC